MMTIYMKAKGINGHVTSKNYKDWMHVHSLQFKTSRSTISQPGKMNNRNASMPEFSEIEILKPLDLGSNMLWERLLTCQYLQEVELHACRAGKEIQPYLKIDLGNALVTRHETILLSAGMPLERIRLSYSKLKRTYLGHDSTGKALAPHATGFDLAQIQQC